MSQVLIQFDEHLRKTIKNLKEDLIQKEKMPYYDCLTYNFLWIHEGRIEKRN
jgi:hypothetical protein